MRLKRKFHNIHFEGMCQFQPMTKRVVVDASFTLTISFKHITDDNSDAEIG
jgi:hypothetical protein